MREVRALTADSPRDALASCIGRSNPAYTIIDSNDRPLAVFGVAPDGDRSGSIWLLGSRDLSRHSRSFLRLSRGWVRYLRRGREDLLWCCIDARNAVHIRWLSWCGFELMESLERHGSEGRRFHIFKFVGESDREVPRIS